MAKFKTRINALEKGLHSIKLANKSNTLNDLAVKNFEEKIRQERKIKNYSLVTQNQRQDRCDYMRQTKSSTSINFTNKSEKGNFKTSSKEYKGKRET